MTLREYASIHLRVPSSGTLWLDEMIRLSLREDFAKSALQGLVAAYAPSESDIVSDSVAETAYKYADAMLAEPRKEVRRE